MDIVFLFYEGMTMLDAIGPHEILARLPDVTVKIAAASAGEIRTSCNLVVHADYSLSDVTHADILLVPGAKSATSLHKRTDIMDWLRKINQTTTWTTSVCTGSLILGAAGLLSGIHATSHWATLDRLPKYGAIPTHGRIVEDGKIITAAGVSAGIDMALMLAAKVSGEHIAKRLQLTIEYDPEPPFNAGSPEKAGIELVNELRANMLKVFEKE